MPEHCKSFGQTNVEKFEKRHEWSSCLQDNGYTWVRKGHQEPGQSGIQADRNASEAWQRLPCCSCRRTLAEEQRRQQASRRAHDLYRSMLLLCHWSSDPTVWRAFFFFFCKWAMLPTSDLCPKRKWNTAPKRKSIPPFCLHFIWRSLIIQSSQLAQSLVFSELCQEMPSRISESQGSSHQWFTTSGVVIHPLQISF